MSGTPRIYIAGPLGFSEAGRHFYASVLVPFVSGLGYDVADPWTLTDARKIEAELGFRPAETFESGLRRTVHWYLDHEPWWRATMDGSYATWIQRWYTDAGR